MSATPEELKILREFIANELDSRETGGDPFYVHEATEAYQALNALDASFCAQAERARVLEEALRPFANLWLEADEDQRPSNPFYQRNEAIATYGDLRRARAALAKATGEA